MKLLVQEENGDSFTLSFPRFEGYIVFHEANDYWGQQGWKTYTVSLGNTILERVINPNYLDPLNAQHIH